MSRRREKIGRTLNENDKLVSVVISTYKVAMVPALLTAVRSVLRQRYGNVEVIVVADEKPKLLSLLREGLPSRAALHINRGTGLSTARNVGIKHANGEIVAFLDDDAIAHPDWIANLVTHYEEPSIMGVGGKIVPLFDEDANSWFPEELNWIVGATYRGYPTQIQEVRNLMGCNMSFRRDKLEEIGGFSREFGKVNGGKAFHDDTEISLRLKNSFERGKLLYTPDAIVYHKVESYRSTLSYIVLRSYLEGQSKSHLTKRKSFGNSSKPLSVEESYISYLLREAIPRRFMKISKDPYNLLSLGAIALSTISVGLGYLFTSS